MKFLPLMWSNLTDKKLRTAFTFFSIVFAFVLYGVLGAVENAFAGGAELAGAGRLRMIHKVTVVQALPVHYYDRIIATEGVARATYVLWFGGVYQDPRNFFPQLAVNATYLDVYPEYEIGAEERQRWLATRTGAIVGKALAERFDWKVGDRIGLRSTIYRQVDGEDTWEFTLEGIFVGADDNVDESQMFFHHEYLEETSPFARGEVRWFVIEAERGIEPAIVAARLDAQFANSAMATKTSTERAFLQSFVNQVGDTALIITSVMGVTFFVILLVVGNAVAHSVRERQSQLAVLKAVGFSDVRVMCFVIGECVLLCTCAGMLGMLLAGWVTQVGVPTQGMTGVLRLSTDDVAEGALWIGLLAIASSIAPAASAFRMRVVTGLGRL